MSGGTRWGGEEEEMMVVVAAWRPVTCASTSFRRSVVFRSASRRNFSARSSANAPSNDATDRARLSSRVARSCSSRARRSARARDAPRDGQEPAPVEAHDARSHLSRERLHEAPGVLDDRQQVAGAEEERGVDLRALRETQPHEAAPLADDELLCV